MTSCRHDSLGRSIYLTSQTLRNFVERILKPFDLTGEQFQLLKHMSAASGLSQIELCELTNKSAANITRILDRLVKKGLVVRRRNPQDRRSSLVFVTDLGVRLTEEVTGLFAAFSAEMEKDIDPVERAVFTKVLAQLEANLNHLSQNLEE